DDRLRLGDRVTRARRRRQVLTGRELAPARGAHFLARPVGPQRTRVDQLLVLLRAHPSPIVRAMVSPPVTCDRSLRMPMAALSVSTNTITVSTLASGSIVRYSTRIRCSPLGAAASDRWKFQLTAVVTAAAPIPAPAPTARCRTRAGTPGASWACRWRGS